MFYPERGSNMSEYNKTLRDLIIIEIEKTKDLDLLDLIYKLLTS